MIPWWLSGKKIHLLMQETWVQSLGWKDPLEKGMVPTPIFLPGEFHRQRTLAGYSPWGLKRVRHDLAIKQQQTISFTCIML